MPSIGAKSATVMAWLSRVIPAEAVPTAASAVTIGRKVAASEPKARKSTTAAAPSPMISASWARGASVSAIPAPPSSTWRPRPDARCAVSTTFRTWATFSSSVGRSKITDA